MDRSRDRVRTLLVVVWMLAAMSGPVLEIVMPASTDAADWQWPVGLLAFAPAAAVILVRRPGNRVGRLLAVTASYAGWIFVSGWLSTALSGAFTSAAFELGAFFGVLGSFWGLISLLYLFPTGSSEGRWWRLWFRIFTVVMLGVLPVLFVFRPGPLDVSGRTNPFGVNVAWLPTVLDAAIVVLPISAIGGVVALVLRFVNASGVDRQQLKLFFMGAVAAIGLVAIISLIPSEIDPTLDRILRPLVILGFWALPLSIVAAIVRYRLYDIDRLVSRTVTYLVVVSILAAGYAATLVGIQALLPLAGPPAVAISTLATASALAPLRRWVQRQVDRRFFRARYDAEALVSDFGSLIRDNVELSHLEGEVAGVVAAALSPVAVSMWVRPERP